MSLAEGRRSTAVDCCNVSIGDGWFVWTSSSLQNWSFRAPDETPLVSPQFVVVANARLLNFYSMLIRCCLPDSLARQRLLSGVVSVGWLKKAYLTVFDLAGQCAALHH